MHLMPRNSRPLSAHALAFALSTSLLGAQTTWRVPGDKATIQEAVAAASDGDRILLVDAVGRYPVPIAGITLAKSLILEAAGTARATLAYPEGQAANAPALTVTALGTKNRVVVRNLDLVGGFSLFTSSGERPAVVSIQLPSASGELVLDGVRAIGEMRHIHAACPGLRLVAGAATKIVLRQCRFEGAGGQSPIFSAGETEYRGSTGAIVDTTGSLIIEDSVIVGGVGGRTSWHNFGPFLAAHDGGKALDLKAPNGAMVNSVAIEGSGGPIVVESTATGYPDPCVNWGKPGDSTATIQADVFHCVRRVVPQGCNQTAKDWPLNIGRRDLDVGSPKLVGTPFRIKAGSLQAGQGSSALLFAVGTGTRTIAGIEGKFYLGDWISLGVLPASQPYSWTEVWFPAPPPGLPALTNFSMQLVHIDAAFSRVWFGSPATFTVLPN